MNLEPQLPDFTREVINRFIKDFTRGNKVVVGVSGGLDSAVVLKLCVDALGPEKVLAVHMPDKVTPERETEDARELARLWGAQYREIKIDKILDSYLQELKVKDERTIGNVKARIRMTLLYAIANEESRFVAGTSNKSEMLTGYFTKYGDGASDFAPIGDLYKTQVRALAGEIGVPEKIINKKPSANLLPEQYDEKELGINYDILDKILYGIELGLEKEKIIDTMKVEKRIVEHVLSLYENSRHKRVLLYIPKIGVKTVNTDWRE